MAERKIDVGNDVTVPHMRFTSNEGTQKEADIKMVYGAMPAASLPVLAAGQAGSTAFDTDTSKMVVWTGAAWEQVTSA